jgi:hypothetical protein
LLPGFLNSSGDGNHTAGGPSQHCGNSSSLTALKSKFTWLYDIFYPHRLSPPTILSPADFLQLWQAQQ